MYVFTYINTTIWRRRASIRQPIGLTSQGSAFAESMAMRLWMWRWVWSHAVPVSQDSETLENQAGRGLSKDLGKPNLSVNGLFHGSGHLNGLLHVIPHEELHQNEFWYKILGCKICLGTFFFRCGTSDSGINTTQAPKCKGDKQQS